MKCMRCKQNEANVYVTTNINGKVKKECLCEKCADTINLMQMKNMDKMLSRIFSPSSTFDMFNFKMPRLRDRFIEASDVFFDDMFNEFDNMSNLVIKIRGIDRYKSEPEDTIRIINRENKKENEHMVRDLEKVENRNKESIEELKKQLEKAVKEERYEDAAVLRDKINGYNV